MPALTTRPAVKDGLKQHCPRRRGYLLRQRWRRILDAVLRLRMKARIIICGAIASTTDTEGCRGPKNYLSLLVNRARMEGIVVFDTPAAITWQWPRWRAICRTAA
jgi:NADPH-dependent curcumin reductase CurA